MRQEEKQLLGTVQPGGGNKKNKISKSKGIILDCHIVLEVAS